MSLHVEGLGLTLPRTTAQGRFQAIHDLELRVEPGQVVAVMGASASGKSLLGLALLGLVPPGGKLSVDRVVLGGEPLDTRPDPWKGRRGRDITWVPQMARASLDPFRTAGVQLDEVARVSGRLDAVSGAVRRAGLSPEILSAYPHTLSGGLAQRVALALALVPQPKVVVADEPTTALDLVTRVRVLDALRAEVDRGLAVVLVTHDLEVARRYADEMVMMQGGRVIARGSVTALTESPRHPRVHALKAAREVAPVDLESLPSGCAFLDCPHRDRDCDVQPELRAVEPSQELACHHPLEVIS